MCLTIEKIFDSEKEAEAFLKNPLIAEKEFPVYKLLEDINFNYISDNKRIPISGMSPVIKFKYEKGFQYSNSKFSKCYNKNEYLLIEEGLHAFTTYKEASEMGFLSDEIIEMWVPKGAKYFLGMDNDIVTNELIWY